MGVSLLPALVILAAGNSQIAPAADDVLTLRGERAQVAIATAGGAIVEFRLVDEPVNPLNWEISEDLEPKPAGKPYLRGHFLCLDRWGAPSDAEAARGVPFHGEAPRRDWQVLGRPEKQDGAITASMSCGLPLAGMTVARQVRLLDDVACFTVREVVTNTNQLGRIYNMVQHPSIAPPFLDETTVIDTNARYGFEQDGPIPASQETASRWPEMEIAGRTVDLRHFKSSSAERTGHDVSSFVFDDDEAYGWVTAFNPSAGLMIGYLWKTDDYPWLNLWRYEYQGAVAARGLEFGTTGYHQPFEVLLEQGRILDRGLFDYLDAGETVERCYAAFLLKVPADYRGAADVRLEEDNLQVVERGGPNPRIISLPVGKLFDK